MQTEKLSELAQVPDGYYNVRSPFSWRNLFKSRGRGGWLSVSRDKEGRTLLLWTTCRDEHNPLAGPAMALTIWPNGTLSSYQESAITMWIKWGHGIGDDKELATAIAFADWAHSKLCATRHP